MRVRMETLIRPVEAGCGRATAERLARILSAEPMGREVGPAEAASLLAWALTGVRDAGEMPLLSMEVRRKLGQPASQILYGDMIPPEARTGRCATFGAYLWNALLIGMMEAPCEVARTDHLKVATDGLCAAASITFEIENGASIIAYHFGALRADAVETVTTQPNAIVNIGRTLLITTPIPIPDALVGEQIPAEAEMLQ